jgi:hypothetical protein
LNQSEILNFAGPGRQPGYFPCSSKESNQRKDVRLAAGTSVAVDWRFLRSVVKLIAAVSPCEETFAGLPPALSRAVVSRTNSAGVCGSRAIRLPAGTGEVKVFAPILAEAQRENRYVLGNLINLREMGSRK